MNLQQSIKENNKIFRESVQSSDGYFPKEADGFLNRSNVKVIRAMEEEHGQAWLIKINLYGDDQVPVIKAITGGDDYNCYNFCCSMIVPKYDKQLEDMILARKNVECNGIKDDLPLVNKIMKHAHKLGGVNLIWS